MTKNTLLLAMALSISVLAGCYSSGVDRNWGRAQRVTFNQQVANPDAPASLETPDGLDPVTGQQAIQGHRKRTAEKATEQVPPSVINIGTSLGGNS